MAIEKLKGVITHDNGDPASRSGLLCQCQLCGKTAPCTPRFDFYSQGVAQPLACEDCVTGKGNRAPFESRLSLYEVAQRVAENTRAACAQIAERIRQREMGKLKRGGMASDTVAEEIRDRILDRQQSDLDYLPMKPKGPTASGKLFD